VVDVKDYQSLKTMEDRTADALLCMDSTLDTVTTFAEMHRQYFEKSSSSCDADEP
jgi:hypothetical protein